MLSRVPMVILQPLRTLAQMMLHFDFLLPIHPRPQALGDGNSHLGLIPAILEDSGQDAGDRERSPVDGPGVHKLAPRALTHACRETAGLVVGADACARDLAPAIFEVVGGARGEESLDVDLADGGGAEIGRRHLEDTAAQAEGGEDLGLRVDHLVEESVISAASGAVHANISTLVNSCTRYRPLVSAPRAPASAR